MCLGQLLMGILLILRIFLEYFVTLFSVQYCKRFINVEFAFTLNVYE